MMAFHQPSDNGQSLDLQIQYRTLSIHLKERSSIAAPDKADDIHQIDAHTLPVDLVYQRFSTSPTLGLESVAVARLIQTFGKNIISPPKTLYWKKVLNYIIGGFNFLMWIAFIVTILSYKPLGEPVFCLGVAILLLLVITVSATFYATVDFHASRIMKSIRSLIAEEATVIRNGELQTVPSVDIVVGDIVLLTLGDRVPADIRIVEASSDLHFDRSLLTGERDLIPGTVKSTSDNVMETRNLALNSTIVAQGKCTGVVFATGDNTIMGRVVTMSRDTKFKLTTVQKEVLFLTKIISAVALGFYCISVIVWVTWSRKTFHCHEKDSSSKELKIDNASINRPFPGGSNYFDLTLYESPCINFKRLSQQIPTPHLRRQLQIHESLYAPALGFFCISLIVWAAWSRKTFLGFDKDPIENTDPIPIENIDPIPMENIHPMENIDPISTAVAQILEIIPNVEPTHLLQLIETHLPTYSVFYENRDPDDDGELEEGAAAGERVATVEEQVQGVVRHVLLHLFENPDYPKVDLRADGKIKGKTVGDPDDEDDLEGKGKEKDSSSEKPKIDYASIDRPFPGGPNYFELALYYLQTSFPQIPKPYLRYQLQIHKSLYAPTHLSVLAAEKSFDENLAQRPYTIKSSRITLNKPQDDLALEEEKGWLDAELVGGGNTKEVDKTFLGLEKDPIENIDPTSTAVAQILEIMPDVEPAYLLQLTESYLLACSIFHGNRDPDDDGGEGAAAGEQEANVEEQVQGVVPHVLHFLFENPDYPKADLRASGKRKAETVGDPDDGDYVEGKAKDSSSESKNSHPIDNIDPTSTAVAQILEIIPNVEPAHVLQLIETHLTTYSGNRDHDDDGGEGAAALAGERIATDEEQVQEVVRHVLHLLFENPDYPKANLRADENIKGETVGDPNYEDDLEEKEKGKTKDSSSKKFKIDYHDAIIDRPFPGGINYLDLALYYIQTSFPHIFKPYLRRQLQIYRSLYQATHFSVLTAEKSQGDVALEDSEEKVLGAELAGDGNAKETETLDDANGDADTNVAEDGEDDETGIECQCCFADYPFSEMVQCPDAHPFCTTCISTYASTQLGTHNSNLTCIHPSSCYLPFPTSELKRILSVKLFELYERLEQQKEIKQAGLVGLEECPFCEWKCVVEDLTEGNLFPCGNEEGGCGVVSCRGCKKLNHLPKSCKEAEEDKHLDGRHAIEEAMTRALMRNCPNCQKAFIKELGCNKMSCPNCQTLSCYVCRQVIKGYDHFNEEPGRPSTSADANKCVLFDDVEERHTQEVKEAAEKAMEEYRRDHPDMLYPLPTL